MPRLPRCPDAPARHGADEPRARRIARPLLWGVTRPDAAEPTPARWTRLGRALTEGDPLADAVADWLDAQGPAGWRVVEQVLDGDRPAGAAPVVALVDAVVDAPTWIHPRLVQRGIAASARSGATGMKALRDLGLMAGYRASAINQTLVRTGALEGGAQRRLARTTRWWMACTLPGGLWPRGPGWRSTLHVRIGHAVIRRRLRTSPDWDAGALGLPVNQLDMQATYLAFSVLFLFGQRWMGVPTPRRDADALMHLWRAIGWLMGVADDLLVDTEAEGRVALYQNLLSQPMADETSAQLGRALMDEPLHRPYRRLAGLQGRWNRAVHLSTVRLFVGRQGMADLGLPTSTVPWYPLLSAGPRLAAHGALRAVPGGGAALERWGRRRQRAVLDTLFSPA